VAPDVTDDQIRDLMRVWSLGVKDAGINDAFVVTAFKEIVQNSPSTDFPQVRRMVAMPALLGARGCHIVRGNHQHALGSSQGPPPGPLHGPAR
jgi:hypothetical protein